MLQKVSQKTISKNLYFKIEFILIYTLLFSSSSFGSWNLTPRGGFPWLIDLCLLSSKSLFRKEMIIFLRVKVNFFKNILYIISSTIKSTYLWGFSGPAGEVMAIWLIDLWPPEAETWGVPMIRGEAWTIPSLFRGGCKIKKQNMYLGHTRSSTTGCF